ncbi:MAG: DNA mismatch repair protein MutS, partial [Candidatus Krumholzibacteria bacterium]|nr:DNA mismatch repair protein MutS [Candidatus Krumholzibacteria bacterium]
INKRLDGISSFCSDQITLRELKQKLHRFPDIERLVSRISTKKAGPRELISLLEALVRIPEIREVLKHPNAGIIREATENLVDPATIKELIESGIEPGCPSYLREGGVIKKGFNKELDLLIKGSEEGRKWIAALQESERKRTGIPSLKVGYNKVFGYYIEVSRLHDSKIPENYSCKQTLISSQRYVTEDLKKREQAILTAESRRVDLEREIFGEICERISTESITLQKIARSIATLDVISSLADLAIERDYCRPEINNSNDLVITQGRHPVVELISGKNFIPNDLVLREEKQVLIITGPNMGGKSTYIRQAALISILAHLGSFVPASRAVVGVMDRIFTRVGSSDNLAKGQSTFLVEMSETAKILHNCTSRSLVLLDEVGRGTSTLDGLSIAWAVTEFLLENDGRRPKTLFATHYHELTHLSKKYPRLQNMRVEIKEWGNSILFLYKICPGASDKSYGLHVARMAGLPEKVIERAGFILESLEKQGEGSKSDVGRACEQTALFERADPLRKHLQGIEIDRMTPLEALELLDNLLKIAKE